MSAEEVLSRSRFAGAAWSLSRHRDLDLATRITGAHPRVRELTDRVSAGPATGLNAAFLLPPDVQHLVEPELLHQAAGGRDVSAMRIADRGLRLLLPYVFCGDKAELVDLTDFPRAAAWLNKQQAALKQRHCVRVWGHDWWDLHDPMKTAFHLRPKILVPDLARSNRFAPDQRGIIPLHSAYYLQPTGEADPVVMAALLNSSANEFLIQTTAPIAKDGFRRYRQQFLLDLIVPEISEKMAERIRQLSAEGWSSNLQGLVDSCFGIDPDEIRQARSTSGLSRP